MRFRSTILVFVTLVPALVLGGGGDQVGNGGGLAEQNVSYGYINLKTIFGFCLQSAQCLSSEKERHLLLKIHNSMEKEYASSQPLKFLSGKLRPDIFKIEGQFKAAVTGNNVGDVIYVNTDLLYPKNHQGQSEPLSIASAMGLLTHELGHHQRVLEHEFLELLGSRIRAFSSYAMTELEVDNYLGVGDIRPPKIKLTAIHKKAVAGSYLDGPESLLLFADEDRLHDLSPWINKAVKICPQYQNKPASKNIGYRIFDLKWGGSYMRDGRLSQRTYLVKARVELFCENNGDPNYPVRFDTTQSLIIELPMGFISGADAQGQDSYWGLRRNSVNVKLKASPSKSTVFF